jgi:protein TonB
LDFAQTQRQPGKHVVGFGVVLALHVLMGWALVSGLAHRVVEVIKGPIETKIIEEVKPPPPPPPDNLPPPKVLPPPPSFVPPPEVNVHATPTGPTITTTTVAPPPAPVTIAPPPAPVQAPPPPPPAPPKQAARPAIANVKACAPTNADYPRAALRAEATGITKVRFNVDATGKLAGVEIVKSAGPSREHKMLDRIAQDKLSECKFTPGADENGKPMGGSFEVEYVWKIE